VNNGSALNVTVTEALVNCSAVAAQGGPPGRWAPRNSSATLLLFPGDARLLAYAVADSSAQHASVNLSVALQGGGGGGALVVPLLVADFAPRPPPPPPQASPARAPPSEPSKQAQIALVLFGLGFAAIVALVARHRYQASVEQAGGRGDGPRAYARVGDGAAEEEEGGLAAERGGRPEPLQPLQRAPQPPAKPAGLQLGALRGGRAAADPPPHTASAPGPAQTRGAALLVLGAGVVATAEAAAAAPRAQPARPAAGWDAAEWDDPDGADSGWDLSDHSLLGSDEEPGSPLATAHAD